MGDEMIIYKKKSIFWLLIVALFLTSGCYTLRKKFVRKKKFEEKPPVYVDFKNYPNKPSKDAYIDYYLFVRGWLEELSESLKQGYSIKRDKRAISEAVMNVEQIMMFYSPQGKEKIYPLYQDLTKIKDTIAKSPNMSDIERNTLVQKIDHFQRKFEAEFNYTDAQKWME